MPFAPQPLSDIHVLDLTRLLPGAVCTLMLADMDADVIKVESPEGGDYARWMPPIIREYGAFFQSSNRGKRSIILNLKDEKGQAVFHRLTENADVIVEGFRPGVTKRLQCDYETIKKINPGIIYCSLSGWGQDGPYAHRSGHDLNYMAINGVLGTGTRPQVLGGQVADVAGAYMGVMGILATLLKRANTGEGDYIDVALSEAAMPFMYYPWVEGVLENKGGGEGAITGGFACYNVYEARDGKAVALGALEPKFWSNFCHAVDRAEWIPLHTDPDEQANLKRILGYLFKTKTADEWEGVLGDVDCCFSVILSPQELMNHPHISARKMLQISEDGVPWMRNPIQTFQESSIYQDAPGYGEHTLEVLRDNGYVDTQIEELIQEGIIKQL